MKTCKAFKMKSKKEQLEHLSKLVFVEEYGDYCNGHNLYTWDDGHRYLCSCPECNALILVQSSEFHGYGDDYFKDYFCVKSKRQARKLNKKYDGFQLENHKAVKRIYLTF